MKKQTHFNDFTNHELFRRKVIFHTSIGISVLIFFGGIIRHMIAPLRQTTTIGISLSFVLFFMSAWVIKKYQNTRIGAILMLTSLFIISMNAGIGNGGLMAPVTVGFILLPVMGAITFGTEGAKYSTILGVLGVALLLLLEKFDLVYPLAHSEKYTVYKSFIYICTILVSFVISSIYEKSRIQVQNELIQQKEKLINSSKMAAIGEMSSGMAHEVNNPLAIIIGKISQLEKKILKQELTPELISEELKKINLAAQRIAEIINGLRTFSENSRDENLSEVQVTDLFQTISLLVSEKLKHHQIDFQIDFNSAQNVFIKARRSQIEQVLLNLINNSFDAVQVLPEKWIRLSVQKSNEQIRILVIDSGLGINSDINQKILLPFFTTKDVGKGSGLGLSIAKGIIEDHQGVLYYEPHSKNTCFVIDLPLSKSA